MKEISFCLLFEEQRRAAPGALRLAALGAAALLFQLRLSAAAGASGGGQGAGEGRGRGLRE